MSGKIFLNYRREDSEAWADRVYERFVQEFGRENVFMDVDAQIPIGWKWAEWLDQEVAKCDMMLSLIGRRWAEEFEKRQAPDARDYVKVEIERALAREIPVVPVLLGEAGFPALERVPHGVQPLFELQAAQLRRREFEADIKVLMQEAARSIKLHKGDSEPEPKPIFTPPSIFQDALKSGGKGPEMVVIPAGSFMMGSPEDEPGRNDWEGPLHEVQIERPFAIGRFAVTRGEFAEFVRASGHKIENGLRFRTRSEWKTDASRDWRNPGFAQADDHPVVGVSHQDAQAYCDWLSKQTDEEYHLPSEAQWEYTCRAGMQTPFWWGDQISPEQANYDGKFAYNGGAKGVYRQKTVPVKTFNANDWGLYQTHGNVWEWCADALNENYQDAPNDGSAWLEGDSSIAILRGGSWFGLPKWLRAAHRFWDQRTLRSSEVGFRLSRTLSSR